MRLWDTLHPYNAVQVMKIDGAADVDRARDAWAQTLATLELGRIRVDGSTFAHEALDDRRSRESLAVVAPPVRLDEHITREMNRPFESDDYCPFRPFILSNNDGSHFAGAMYQHWVADSVAVRALLREWFLRMHVPDRAATRAMSIPPDGFWAHFGPNRCKWRIDDAIAATLRLRTRFSRVRQMPEHAGEHHAVAVSLHAMPDGLVDPILARARSLGVTLNDVCLAAVAEACHRYGATPPSPGRDELALGTIVDLRAMSPRPMDDLFGMFLGFITTVVRQCDAQDFRCLLQRIAVQNAHHKRTRGPQSSVLRMAVALLEASVTTPARWADSYRRKMPMAGGMSNVNMTRTWAREHHPAPLVDYLRVAPTGPTVPLVFSVTTLGAKFNFGLTRRVGLIDDARATRLAHSVINRLMRFADRGRRPLVTSRPSR